MSAILAAHELGRYYGQVVGLNDVSLEVRAGVTGLIGPNGAGKSTLLKLIVGEIKPTRGSLTVLGEKPFANRRLFRRLGFCPQQDALYDGQTALEFVRTLLRLSGFGAAEAKRRALVALERVGLAEAMHRRCGGFSKGMRQRARIAQAIAHDPELVVLDEPLNGLDPIGRREILELLRQLGLEGKSVLLSSHVLHEVQDLTEEIVLIHRGRLLAQGSVPDVRELLTRFPRKVDVLARDARGVAAGLLGWEGLRAVQVADDGERVTLETRDVGELYRRVTALAAAGSYGIHGLSSVDAGLEAVFDYLVG